MRVSVGVNTSSHKSHLEPIFDLPNEQTTFSTFGMVRLATVALSKIYKVALTEFPSEYIRLLL